MATLDTVQKLITESRVLLQDTVAPYRYADAELIEALNIAVLEARRLRPEMFLGQYASLPSYSTPADTVALEAMYRPSFVYYMAGRMQLRDDEPAQDSRAAALLNKFVSQLLTIAS